MTLSSQQVQLGDVLQALPLKTAGSTLSTAHSYCVSSHQKNERSNRPTPPLVMLIQSTTVRINGKRVLRTPRSRFAVEVVKTIVDAAGAQRTVVRLSPCSTYHGIGKLSLAYVHALETLDFFLEIYKVLGGGPVITGGYMGQSAKEAVEGRYKGYDVVVGVGLPWTANLDPGV
ncbi:uncharacterized protein BDW43DRAFT_314863 [Aspergillus alliaceus]|uniref:uncharacterized protein n=1 Tax=Petromyces alliaceus TaxID=209559 RepID=UPI0012A6E03F|nr:uncharacterized protein BDW43DRAFT_314863 [Aspergillus alliaceus]KAB8229472.1 hypothetical protein BDW43DRAFT_314863 [Aspergillus alliaceus]